MYSFVWYQQQLEMSALFLEYKVYKNDSCINLHIDEQTDQMYFHFVVHCIMRLKKFYFS